MTDLRAAAQTPPARLNVKTAINEDDAISRSATPINGRRVSGGINCKKSSIATLGKSRLQYSTQFDDIIEVFYYTYPYSNEFNILLL